ncbi:karyopherin-like protein [Phlyctema vagabunda]|uniref:Karyopherin-like protein n=1 Tax=Phlyctema vagabunda TaxID=108571 RepID=A0ABR4PFF4_9HELO
MDQGKFLELLQSVQVPDTTRVKAATTELRKNYYPNPESLVWLLQLLTSHQDVSVRQQAGVEALRLVPKHWEGLPADQKPVIHETLLKATLNEQAKLVRHSAARVISAIASIDLEGGLWDDLPGALAQAATSPQVSYREVGVYILFALLEAAGDIFADKLPGLFSLFANTIKDPESGDVRSNTMLALSRMALLIDADENPEALKAFTAAVPSMVNVLKEAVNEDDEDRAMQAFEVFQTLLGCEAALLNPHFKDLISFMIELGADTNLSAESRSQAISFLMQCVKYRKMKVQSIKDAGKMLTLKSMEIATEIPDDEDVEDDEEITPHRSAFGLLDLLATSLPPRQVIVPLLEALPQYVNSDRASFRKAGILALSMCVEGAPDFIATQLDNLFPIVLRLLNDPVIGVRQAALNSVARLADELVDELSKFHEQLIPALLKNLDAACEQAASESDQKMNIEMLKSSCGALDSLVDGVEKEVAVKYASELVPRLGRLFAHPDFKVKASAAGAMGSLAGSSEDAFLPYFEPTMKALSEYVTMKASEEELDLRCAVCDAMGYMATAVGPAAFQPYVQPLMHASEEALHLDHPRLRETSYILWSVLSKVYEEEFTPFLDGVVKSLLECLGQEESDLEVELGENAQDLLGQEVVIQGKKVKVTAATDDEDDMDDLDDEDDEDDWDDLTAVTAVALEKEIAAEVIADVLSHTRQNFIPYLEKTIETVMGLVEHSYEGVRKVAIATLWRAYACLWALMEDHTGSKWTPGLPLKSQPTAELIKLGEVVTTATLSVWEDEVDSATVTDINRNVSATLKLCGPAVLTQEKMLERTVSIISTIITKSHPCQTDMGDDDFDEEMESSEYDWLLIDTALDVVIGLSAALGDQFGELWQVFQKQVMKFASSETNFERSTAIGVIAECTANMGSAVTPFTSTLLKLLIHRLSDEDAETKSNAAYATGLLIFHSTDSATYLPSFNTILTKIEPLLHTQHARTLDNAAGCVSRMIMAHQDKMPISDIMSVLVEILPLTEDYEENKPIYECIIGLLEQQEPTVMQLLPKLIPIFASVMGEPAEQLDMETRKKMIHIVKLIAQKQPDMIKGHEQLVGFM